LRGFGGVAVSLNCNGTAHICEASLQLRRPAHTHKQHFAEHISIQIIVYVYVVTSLDFNFFSAFALPPFPFELASPEKNQSQNRFSSI